MLYHLRMIAAAALTHAYWAMLPKDVTPADADALAHLNQILAWRKTT